MIRTVSKSAQAFQRPGREHEQVIQNAEAELVSLAHQIAACEQAISSAQSELHALDAKEQVRVQRMATARNSVEAARQELEEAQTRSSLQAGTMATNKVDIAGFERQARRAQADLTKLSAQANQEAQIDNERRQVVQTMLDNHERILPRFLHKQTLTEQARDRAQADLGQAILDSCLEHLTEWRKQIEEKEQQLAQAREAQTDWGRDAVNSLADWPELAATLTATLPYHDQTTSAIEAALALVTVLLTEGHELANPGSWFLERAGLGKFMSFDNLLCLETDLVRPAIRYTGIEPVGLQQRQIDLEKLLKAYIESRKQGEVI